MHRPFVGLCSLKSALSWGDGMETSYATVAVDPDLMLELLNAAARTAMTHRNHPNEMFVLGQLEATANAIYVMAVAQGFEELESTCQRLAFEALNRLNDIGAREARKANVVTPAWGGIKLA